MPVISRWVTLMGVHVAGEGGTGRRHDRGPSIVYRAGSARSFGAPVHRTSTPDMTTRVAFLGLGAIGAPMARHLARPPFELAVWNRTAAKAEAFAAATPGARLAATPADAARGAAFVVTCLPTSHEVEALLDGPGGLLAGLGSG